jgi:hypothetical protein
LIFAAASLAWMFFRHFKNRVSIAWTRGAAAVLAEFKTRSGTDYRLYLGAAAVILLMAFPQWGRPLLAKPNNPCAAANPCGAKPPSRK